MYIYVHIIRNVILHTDVTYIDRLHSESHRKRVTDAKVYFTHTKITDTIIQIKLYAFNSSITIFFAFHYKYMYVRNNVANRMLNFLQ